MILNSLGAEAFYFWLQQGIIFQFQEQADALLRLSDPQCLNLGQHIKSSLQSLETSFYSLRSPAVCESGFSLELPFMLDGYSLPSYSQKLLKLVELLLKLYKRKSDDSFRGIVFVEQVAMTYTMVHVVNKLFRHCGVRPDGEYNSLAWPMLPVSGTSSMKESTRSDHLKQFKHGKVLLLVSTNSLEEGIDVENCSFVVRFDEIKSTKAHIQGSGRVRSANGNVYYFDNDPLEECRNADELYAVARNKYLNISADQLNLTMRSEIKTTAQAGDGIYPYFPSPGTHSNEVNMFNCIPILYEYVQSVMRQPFEPESCLFTKMVEITSEIPYVTTTIFTSVRYPTPEGYQVVDRNDSMEYWGDTDLSDLITAERSAMIDDLEKKKLVFVAVVQLHKNGYLNNFNKPSNEALSSTREACESLGVLTPRINLKNSFKSTTLNHSK